MQTFRQEAEMLSPVIRWLEQDGLATKSEVAVPWGVCDLVGCRLDSGHVAVRRRQGQTSAVGPLSRVQLLLSIPDSTCSRGINPKRLEEQFDSLLGSGFVEKNAQRLIRSKFVVPTKTGSLKKVNGWHPLHDRIVAVELKRRRVSDALAQAISNFGFAHESFIGMPMEIASRIADGERAADFEKARVGLLGVRRDSVRLLIPCSPRQDRAYPDLQAWIAEGFLANQLV